MAQSNQRIYGTKYTGGLDMSVYEKLNKARIMFQTSGVKKTGKNKFAGYDYFELNDILPVCNRICNDIKASCVVSFGDGEATLEFVDSENPTERIVFRSPMSTASLKGCHEVQNLGVVESYIKRYLYQNCFEISEHDALDATMNPNDTKRAPQVKPLSKQDEATLDFVMDIINSGELNGEFLRKAEWIHENKDVDGAKKLLHWYNNERSA